MSNCPPGRRRDTTKLRRIPVIPMVPTPQHNNVDLLSVDKPPRGGGGSELANTEVITVVEGGDAAEDAAVRRPYITSRELARCSLVMHSSIQVQRLDGSG